MADILQEIVAHKRCDLDRLLCKRVSMAEALRQSPSGIIAEFKRKSPSKGWIHADVEPENVIPRYVEGGAAALILEIIDACERNCVRFYAIPQLRTYLKRKMQLEILGSIPVLSIRDNPLDMLTNRIIKRTFDIVVSAIFMIPFWLLIYPVIAILTHYLQPGPVFFKQKRNGLNGKEFVCYKFRSMKVGDKEKILINRS